MNTQGAQNSTQNPPGMAAHYNTGAQSASPRSGLVSTNDSRRQDVFTSEDELRHRAMNSTQAYEGTRPRSAYQNAPVRGQAMPQPPRGFTPTVASRTPVDPVRKLDNPDLTLSPCGPDGHPMSEWAIGQAGPDTSLEDDCDPPNLGYGAGEEERIQCMRAKPLKEGRFTQPSWRESNQRALGRFHHFQILTLEQVWNLIAFLNIGQLRTWPPFRFSSALKQDIERARWVTISGAPRASHGECHPGPMARRCAQEQNIPGPFTVNVMYGDRGADVFTRTVSSDAVNAGPSRTHQRVHNPTRPHPLVDSPRPRYGPMMGTPSQGHLAPNRPRTPVISTDKSQGYPGLSPPNPNDISPARALSEFPDATLAPNTRWTAGELSHWYMNQHPSMWARGIMNASGGIATALGDTAQREDILYLPIIPTSRWHRTSFTLVVLYLFSIPGLFAHIVHVGGYPVGTIPMGHYDSLTDNMTLFLAAAWNTLAPAATSWRGYSMSPTPNEMDAAATLAYYATRIPRWEDIRHAPHCPDALRTDAGPTPGPSSAGDGLAASVHAVPMEDVQGTAPLPAPEGPEGPDVLGI
ncbi:hypothetical protein DFH06DRAFT_1130494 [Mycena polygramma]|nr:hypothetical protein DFH06DRAFT_1130494 [Mycena polygramma]